MRWRETKFDTFKVDGYGKGLVVQVAIIGVENSLSYSSLKGSDTIRTFKTDRVEFSLKVRRERELC